MDKKDRIGQLPDDILAKLLSSLTMKEVGRTSVLSRRWVNLWKLYTGSLDFDFTGEIKNMQEENITQETIRPTYIKWVNHVLNSHHGRTINEFRVQYYLDETFKTVIDRWINFAIEKKVQKLDLDFSSYGYYVGQSQYGLLNLPLRSPCFDSLTNLRLKAVDVTGEVLAYLFSSCLFLEQLSVIGSRSLVNLEVGGPSLKLKHLELIDNANLKLVEISAIKLFSFKFVGKNAKMLLKNTPVLTKLSFGGRFAAALFMIYRLLFNAPALETLILDMNEVDLGSVFFPGKFPEIFSVKQLEVKFVARLEQRMFWLTWLLASFPCLSRLVLKIRYGRPLLWTFNDFPKKAEHSHQCLKVVEIIGWDGQENEFELVTCLLENAVLLQKLIIDPHTENLEGIRKSMTCVPCNSRGEEDEEAARKRAKQLETKLPPAVELVIL